MQVAKDTVVTLAYRMTNMEGEVLEEATEAQPAVYLHGGYDGIFPKVEETLEGQPPGTQADILLEPDDAFGNYDAELVRMEAADLFPPEVEVGMQFEGVSEDGSHQMLYTVTDIADGQVVVDGNHPLAGLALRIQCQVLDVRQASSEEIEHGHVHGPDGHHHHH